MHAPDPHLQHLEIRLRWTPMGFWVFDDEKEGSDEGWKDGSVLFYCMPSRICKHTNTPSLVARDWFLDYIAQTALLDPGIR